MWVNLSPNEKIFRFIGLSLCLFSEGVDVVSLDKIDCGKLSETQLCPSDTEVIIA